MAPMRFDTDVFVVGGGPAGLAAAIAARCQGMRVMLADALRPPIDKACGEGLMPDSLAELAQLGVSLDGREHGTFRGIRFLGARHSVQAEFPRGHGIGIRRTALHAALIDRAGQLGVEMHWSARIAGVRDHGVVMNGCHIRSRWVVGADGHNSRVRAWAGLDAGREFERRLAVRQHFRTPESPAFVEIHWGKDAQAYVTPISTDEICVAIIARRKLASFVAEVDHLPTLAARLRGACASSTVRGAVTVSNRLLRVRRDHIALIGDASGSVDAITGEGLALSFRQAFSLAQAMAANDLSSYQAQHREIQRLPHFMRRVMLLMDKSPSVQRRAITALQARPRLFERMLAVHVGELPILGFGITGVANLTWQMLTA